MKTKNQFIASLLAMAAMVTSFVFGSLAYFTDIVSSPDNSMPIRTGRASAELLDVTLPYGSSEPTSGEAIAIFPGYVISKTVTVKNTGTYPLYARVKISYDITLDERYADMQGSIDKSLVSLNVNTESWKLIDGYYYYVKPLLCEETSPELMTAISFSSDMGNMYKDSTLTFDIVMEVVQSNNNGTSVFDAIGWTSSENGGR